MKSWENTQNINHTSSEYSLKPKNSFIGRLLDLILKNDTQDSESGKKPVEENFSRSASTNFSQTQPMSPKLKPISIKFNSPASESLNLLIPCTNCNNLVPTDEIDAHSDICHYVKTEVSLLEKNPNPYQKVDSKLKKLCENIIKIKKDKDEDEGKPSSRTLSIQKDISTITLLHEYITSALDLCYLNHKTVVALKNLIINIDSLILGHKGHISSLILLERAKVLVLEKYNIIREDIRKKKESEKINSRTSNQYSHVSIKEEMEEIKKEIENELKKKQCVDVERDSIKRKVNAFKKMTEKENQTPINQNEILEKSCDSGKDEKSDLEDFKEKNNKIFKDVNIINEITSDVESDCSLRKSSSSFFTNSTISNRDNLMSDYSSNRETIDSDADQTPHLGNIRVTPFITQNTEKGYKDFVKIFLKIKFEKLGHRHLGQRIPEKAIWKEIQKHKIPFEKWAETIEKEMNNPEKYNENIKSKNYK